MERKLQLLKKLYDSILAFLDHTQTKDQQHDKEKLILDIKDNPEKYEKYLVDNINSFYYANPLLDFNYTSSFFDPDSLYDYMKIMYKVTSIIYCYDFSETDFRLSVKNLIEKEVLKNCAYDILTLSEYEEIYDLANNFIWNFDTYHCYTKQDLKDFIQKFDNHKNTQQSLLL